jgi:hypothetical protein
MPPSILIETLDNPRHYTTAQLDRARRIAKLLDRGRLVLCELPGSDLGRRS